MKKYCILKKCSKCKETKQLSEFNKSRQNKDGLRAFCNSCRNIYKKKYRKTKKGKVANKRYKQSEKGKASDKRFAARYPNRIKAKWAVNHAISVGKMQKASFFKCKYCPVQAQQYHHPSYAPEHWLDVIPVCVDCHQKAKGIISNKSGVCC